MDERTNGRTEGRTDGRTDACTDGQATNERMDVRTPEKRKIQSMSQAIDLIVTIQTHTESSKSELSSRGKRPFKVSKYFTDDNYTDDKNISGAEGG